jgi:hypothetical protein
VLSLLTTAGATVRLPYVVSGSAAAHTPASLDVALIVKENAGVGAVGYPVSAVIPLPAGAHTTTASLGIVGSLSQVEVVNRWPQDDSLRHVLVHFQPSVAAGGDAVYRFTDGGRIAPPVPVAVAETTGAITVTTGPLRFTVNKTAFNLVDQLWLDQNADGQYEAGEQIIASHGQNGGVFTPRDGAGPIQYDASRPDVRVEIEEHGPLRVVIRAEALTQFVSATQHTHGFAARIYAYAGKPYLKIDYQLQNSAKDVVRSWPLYFEALSLDLRLGLAANPTVSFGTNGGVFTRLAAGGLYQAQEMHNRFRIYDRQTQAVLYDSGVLPNGVGPEGFIDVSDAQHGVTAIIRNFWQMWPNGLAIDDQNRLSLQLFPPWSAQWFERQLSPTGLYWLDDMQHTYKEALLFFHGPTPPAADLSDLSRTFQFHPVAIVPIEWYRQTRATLDLGGVIPPDSVIPAAADQRQPEYFTEGSDPADWYDASGPYYGAGWVNFHDPEPGYRSRACTAGGWPYSEGDLIASGNPSDYFVAEAHGMGEINLRPEWMAGYTHDVDWSRLQLSENGYCNGRWRIHEGNGVSKLAAPPLPGTSNEDEHPAYDARDDQHGWFYHVAESYFYTANAWVRDWHRFIAEFRRVRLERLDPFPDYSSRATGHTLNQALQAYRVTGDASLLTRFRDHLRIYLRPEQDPYYGDQRVDFEPSGGGFPTGYLMRAIVDYLEEVRGRDWQAYAEGFNYLSGLMEWNYHYGNFPFYFDARLGGTGASSGTGLTLVDPQAWYYWHTGRQRYLDQLDAYVTTGINGRETPYGEFAQWRGQFEGRYYLYVKNTVRADITPPPAVADLTAVASGAGVRLEWTAPADGTRYHIVWSTRPITEHSTDPGSTNWWAAEAVGPALAPIPGARQTWLLDTGSNWPIYAALFTFDSAENMSDMSNVARARLAAPAVTIGRAAAGVELRWPHTDSRVARYEVYRSATPYFATGDPGATKLGDVIPPSVGDQASHADAGAFSPPLTNYFYLARGVDAANQPSLDSNGTAVFNFSLTPGAP